MNNQIALGNISLNRSSNLTKSILCALLLIAVVSSSFIFGKQDTMLVVIGAITSLLAYTKFDKIVAFKNALGNFVEVVGVAIKSVVMNLLAVTPRPSITQTFETTYEERERSTEIFMLALFSYPALVAGIWYMLGSNAAMGVILATVVGIMVLSSLYLGLKLVKNVLLVTFRVAKLLTVNAMAISAYAVNLVVSTICLITTTAVVALPVAYIASLALMVQFGGETGYVIVTTLFAVKAVLYVVFSQVAKSAESFATSTQIVKQIVTTEIQTTVKTFTNTVKTSKKKQKSYQHFRPDLLNRESNEFSIRQRQSLQVYGSYAHKALKGLGLSSFRQNWMLQIPIDHSQRSSQLAM